MRVVLGLGVAARRRGTGRAGVGLRRVGDVEERDLGALGPALGVGLLADADQPALAGRLQVRRVPGDLQLAGDRGRGRVGQVERVERVGLPERHHVAGGPMKRTE